jgi:hypothetical protein
MPTNSSAKDIYAKIVADMAEQQKGPALGFDNSPYLKGPGGEEIATKLTSNPYGQTAIATAIEAALPIASMKSGTKDTKGAQSQELIRNVAKDYAKNAGLKSEVVPQVEVNPKRAKAIAEAFDKMPHNPEDLKVKSAYSSLIKETMDQFNSIMKTGLKITPIKEGVQNPYKDSKAMIQDVKENGHLYYYPTEQGFGTSNKVTDNPLLQETSAKVNGKPLLANDVFRIVHDYFGHVKEGTSFGPKGEENAWRQHMPMYTQEAQNALTTETRGQNSWVNYGPKGELNRSNPANTQYADQKTGILPEWAKDMYGKTPIIKENNMASEDDKKEKTKKQPSNLELQKLGMLLKQHGKAAMDQLQTETNRINKDGATYADGGLVELEKTLNEKGREWKQQLGADKPTQQEGRAPAPVSQRDSSAPYNMENEKQLEMKRREIAAQYQQKEAQRVAAEQQAQSSPFHPDDEARGAQVVARYKPLLLQFANDPERHAQVKAQMIQELKTVMPIRRP